MSGRAPTVPALGKALLDVQDAALTLLASRADGATVCPSEIARAVTTEAGGTDWRAMMPAVHAAVDRLVVERRVRLSWKGEALAERQGPYRISRGEAR